MYVLNTNVVSELIRQAPECAVTTWTEQQNVEELFLPAVSKAELLYGIAILPLGKRRTTLENSLDLWFDLGFGDRILPFDSTAAEAFAEIAVNRRRAGRLIGEADCQIAAISLVQDGTVVTRNVRDFEGTGVSIVDPWLAVRN